MKHSLSEKKEKLSLSKDDELKFLESKEIILTGILSIELFLFYFFILFFSISNLFLWFGLILFVLIFYAILRLVRINLRIDFIKKQDRTF